MNKEHFKISSALKNLIGRELITDEYIAVFELVKNAYDAHAKKVEIIFEDLYSNNNKSRIIIKDDGKGMNYDDLLNKWLFVAYSAKVSGEEDLLKDGKESYRDKIHSKRIFAGAKGVGRFSCDRLGTKLNLITIKDEENSKIENLVVNWELFEKDQEDEFIEIDVTHDTLENNPYKAIKHGTILEISGLRDTNWDRDKLLKLKFSLEKLISPSEFQEKDKFSIKVIVLEEKINDNEEIDKRKKVNGEINNFLFEDLAIKTTFISTEIIEEGKIIFTTLSDRGRLIYQLKEKNSYPLHSNIKIVLFQLNFTAKLNFHKQMGMRSVDYGSVFMYKNGFRIYPFGEENEDLLGIDRRKQQGYNRNLGTRDLIGRIEINDPQNIDNLKETTSRDGGLIKNKNSEVLTRFFYDKALKRLENYVVDLIKWGDPIKDKITKEELRGPIEPEEIKKEIIYYITDIGKDKKVIDLYYDKDFLDSLIDREEENLPTNIKKLAILAEKTNDPQLQKRVRKVEKQFQEIQSAFEEQKIELNSEKDEKEKIKKEVEQSISENLFLRSITGTEIKEVASLQHHIGRGASKIERNIRLLKESIEQNEAKELLFDFIEKISMEVKKISTLSNFITKANFNTTATTVKDKDLVEFITEYIENVYKNYEHLKINNKLLRSRVNNNSQVQFKRDFRPLEIIIVLDNLIDNSEKNGARSFQIEYQLISKDKLEIIYTDDGIGVKQEIKDKIFDFGFTTTSGSGLGLFHVKQIIERMNGKIKVNIKVNKGVKFIIEVQR
jgi:signal transduction histidine kinase